MQSDQPMREDLQAWFNEQRESTDDDLSYKKASALQIMFVRDELSSLVFAGAPYEHGRTRCWVISEHTSKSVRLPVYSIEREDIGLRVVLRENFYNWKLSVISRDPVQADFSGLFYTTPPVDPKYTGNPLSPVYFEGFPDDLIFGYYEAGDRRKWSAAVWGDQQIWTVLFLLMRSMGAIQSKRWHTKESRAKELTERDGNP